MSVDLTRFDFHVYRFMNSPDVERMTAEEVGQYFLLLCKSWANGDECCLPLDKKYLASVARVDKVSKRVMEKFEEIFVADPASEKNQAKRVIRNNALYEEWLAAMDRSKTAQDKALRRWQPEPVPDAVAHAPALHRHMPSNAEGNAQAVPSQANHPKQANQQCDDKRLAGDVLEELQAQTLEESQLGGLKTGQAGYFKRGQYPGTKPKVVFAYMAKAWSRSKGEAAFCRYPKYAETFELLCDQKSGDLIVPAFELWIEKHGSRMSTQWPVPEFVKVAEEFMAKVIPLNKTRPEVTEADLKQITENAAKMHMEVWKPAPVEEENKEGLTELFGPEQPEKS